MSRFARLIATATLVAIATAACGGDGSSPPKPELVSGAGDITAVVDRYRSLLGADNGGEPVSKASGFREVNWDSVPDAQSAPNPLPGDFFNAKEAPRARGLVLSTPGAALMVSASTNNPAKTAPRFGNINAKYSDSFRSFSGERLFSPVGSNIAEVTFTVPGTTTAATVRGFGAVYTDIDTEHTAFEYFDTAGKSLGTFRAPVANNGLSFLGVVFKDPIIAKVRVSYGTTALGPDDSTQTDVAVMDNFIYAEPVAKRV